METFCEIIAPLMKDQRNFDAKNTAFSMAENNRMDVSNNNSVRKRLGGKTVLYCSRACNCTVLYFLQISLCSHQQIQLEHSTYSSLYDYLRDCASRELFLRTHAHNYAFFFFSISTQNHNLVLNSQLHYQQVIEPLFSCIVTD